MKVDYLKRQPSVEWALPRSTQERRGVRLFPGEGLEQRGHASQAEGLQTWGGQGWGRELRSRKSTEQREAWHAGQCTASSKRLVKVNIIHTLSLTNKFY